jgi:hypothetical protein
MQEENGWQPGDTIWPQDRGSAQELRRQGQDDRNFRSGQEKRLSAGPAGRQRGIG